MAGSPIGGLDETEEMRYFCGEHNIVCDIETISSKDANTYGRTVVGNVSMRAIEASDLDYAILLLRFANTGSGTKLGEGFVV
jgi:hypothetical protein